MEYRLGTMEYRFLSLIWENEPVSSMHLVRLCSEHFEWKKSTTFTMLKRLQEKGLVRNENSVVSSVISPAEVRTKESEAFVSETFKGSLPSFIAAFLGNKTISRDEAEELKKLIDSFRKGE